MEDLHNFMNQYFPDYCTMLQNPSRVKDSFRVPDQKQDQTKTNQKNKVPDRPMDFNVIEYNKFINVVLDSVLQLLFKKLPCIKFDLVSKKNVCKDECKICLPFLKTYLCQAGFLSNASPKTVYHDRQNAEANRIIRMFSVNIKEISKI